MLGKIITFTLILCGTAVVGMIGAPPCPITNHNGSIISGSSHFIQGTLVASSNGIIPLVDGQDSQCYNYSLPYAFMKVPEIAIAVHDFESQRSNNLFYYIKPLQTQSTAFVPFVVRTLWAYTRWTRISFSFLAEDRNQFQSGYYQIDSGLLAGCSSGKQIKVLLPFRTNFLQGSQIQYCLFLHGYEISTMLFSQNRRSPYEIQIAASSVNVSGIAVTLSVTTITQVNSIYVSYTAFQNSNLNIAMGEFIYDPNNGQGFSHAPAITIPRNYARIYGITGFIINYDAQNIHFRTQWTGFQFKFHLGSSESLTKYLTYHYMFFIGSECGDCPGYPISFNGTCVNVCPTGSFLTPEGVCLSCGEGRAWNGSACQKICPTGQYRNPLSDQCQCPPTLNWNGQRCIVCTAGKIFNRETKSCDCVPPFKWNGFACARLKECVNGTIWNVYTYRCECPQHQYYDNRQNRCIDIPQCTGGRILDATHKCVCPSGYYWSGERCQYSPCVGGQVLVGSRCLCPTGRNWNGTLCIECINGQQWMPETKTCECPNGYNWNGQFCNRTYNCSAGRVWDSTIEQCICPKGQIWNGRQCTIIPECSGNRIYNLTIMDCECRVGFKWNTTQCVQCINGKVWDQPSLRCLCPRGTVEDDITGECRVMQVCRNGQTWNQNIWQCQCPANTVFNGIYCILNPCSNGRFWDDQAKACKCPDQKIWDSRACVPPRIDCTNGRVWDNSIYACTCPVGTFPNINKCDPIPNCSGGQHYNPLNNKCECPYSLIFQNGRCTEPNCPDHQYWNGNSCVMINCPPGSFYQNHKCVTKDNDCQHSYYWDGQQCRYYQLFCPFGTVWINQTCKPIGNCQVGYYQNSQGTCQQLPQKCTPPTYWNNNKCQVQGNNCPKGAYYSDNTCKNNIPCQNGHVWDPIYLKCACPPGQQSNGNRCIQCTGGKQWIPGVGCRCPLGMFDLGSSCQSPDQNRCSNIPNAQWMNNMCQCSPGYTKIGLQCVCYGVEQAGICDRCSQKPNSQWNQFLCQCINGYTQINGICMVEGNAVGNDDPKSCNVGSYFDANHRKCIGCSNGCLSCVDSKTCTLCRPQFYFYNGFCLERCGDGKKFVLPCDDGNNDDGDGCSRDCKIESGSVCQGGSPDSPDNCNAFGKNFVTLTLTGQIRMPTSIILNIKLDYLPKALISSSDCANQCHNILVGEITEGDMSEISITSHYIPGTTFTFAVKINFDRPYIGDFSIKISVDRAISLKYFNPVSTANPLTVMVRPSFLASVNDRSTLN